MATKAKDDFEDEVTKALSRVDVSLPALVVITNGQDLVEASSALREIATKKRNLEEERKSITRPIDEAKSVVMAKFKPFIDELDRRDAAIRSAITTYNREEAARQKEEQARLRDEQAKLQAEAEAKALKLMAAGKQNQAVAVMTSVPPVPTVVTNRPSTPGIATLQTWKYRVTSLLDLVVFAMESGNTDYILVNDKLMGEIARSTKGKSVVPGIEFYPEDGLRVSRS